MPAAVTVLVIDDEPDVRWALQMMLLKHGFGVALVGSGAEALLWLQQQTCQVMLLDAKLGDVDGFELAGRIQKLTRCAAPIILVSGYFYKDDSAIQLNLRAGVIAAFVTKPFRHDDILKAIRGVLVTGNSGLPRASIP
jgi:DNA-binding response OmpR family regulator